MLTAVEGKYEDGRIELLELPPGIRRSRVIVTFVEDNQTTVAPRNEHALAAIRAFRSRYGPIFSPVDEFLAEKAAELDAELARTSDKPRA